MRFTTDRDTEIFDLLNRYAGDPAIVDRVLNYSERGEMTLTEVMQEIDHEKQVLTRNPVSSIVINAWVMSA